MDRRHNRAPFGSAGERHRRAQVLRPFADLRRTRPRPGRGRRRSPMEKRRDMTETFRDALGAELRRMRDHKGWTRGALKSRLPFEVAEPTIGAWEHGLRGISAERLVPGFDVLGDAGGGGPAPGLAPVVPPRVALDPRTASPSRLPP